MTEDLHTCSHCREFSDESLWLMPCGCCGLCDECSLDLGLLVGWQCPDAGQETSERRAA